MPFRLPPSSRSLLRSRCSRLWLGIAIVLVASVVLAARFLSAPSQGHQVPATDHQLASRQTARPQPVAPVSTLDNSYFSLALPPGYLAQAPTALTGLLYSQTITKPGDFGSLIINLAVKGLPGGDLSQDSNYSLRLGQADRYTLSRQTVGGETVYVANDHQSAAVVAFWPHDGKLATISVSSGLADPSTGDNSDELRALQPLLQAWRWR